MQRFLILAPWQCAPPQNGAKLRNFHLSRALAVVGPVSYAAFQEPGVALELLPFCRETLLVDHTGGYSISDLVGGALTSTPMTIRKYTRGAMSAVVRQVLGRGEEISGIQLEGPHLASYVPLLRRLAPRAKIVVDWHNIESEIMGRYAEQERRWFRRTVAALTAPKIAQLERRLVRDADAHIAVSARDADALRSWEPGSDVRVIGNGVDLDAFTAPFLPAATRVLFVGAMDYHANIEGAQWFVKEIWPTIVRARPDLRLTIVGRNPVAVVRDLSAAPNVEVTGTVDAVAPYYAEALLSVVPLLVGGGSRLKILESMAARVPVVATTLGAEGLTAKSGEHLEIADTAAAFAHTTIALANNPERLQTLSTAARQLVESEYGWDALGEQLRAYWGHLLAVPNGRR